MKMPLSSRLKDIYIFLQNYFNADYKGTFLTFQAMVKMRYSVKRFDLNKISSMAPPLLLIHGTDKKNLMALSQYLGASHCHYFCSAMQAVSSKNFTISAVKKDFLSARLHKNKILGICFREPQSEDQETQLNYELASYLVQSLHGTVLPITFKDTYCEGDRWHKLLCIIFLRKRFIINFGSVEKIKILADLQSQQLETIIKLRDIFSLHAFYNSNTNNILYKEIQKSLRRFPAKTICCSDVILGDIAAPKFAFSIKVMARKFQSLLKHDSRVGVLLPNSIGLGIAFLALQACKKTPAMLNYSTGLNLVLHSIQLAQIKTIITSHQFLRKANLEELEEGLKAHINFVYLEDIRAKIAPLDILLAIINPINPKNQSADEEAVILYTSGSEGSPKGVALSHRNILANLAQIHSRLEILQTDHLLNPLPMFHSFGLTAGFLFPIYAGIHQTLYPSPLHYKEIPELIHKNNITILLSTDTFLKGYARVANPNDFQSLRLAVAGAEALRSDTRQLYLEKFKTKTYEGYGVTETSPVLSVNTPVFYKDGSVGRLFPAIEYRLEAVDGLHDGQRLLVRGANIMLGYINPIDIYHYLAPKDGWYDTGDIVSIDDHDFIFIKGRLKRFAKIGGEMISLSAVENFISQFDSAESFAAISLKDSRRGERIVILTTAKHATKENIRAFLLAQKIPTLMFPSEVIVLDIMPLLPNGKINYILLQQNFAV